MDISQLHKDIFGHVSTIIGVPKVFYPNINQTSIPDEYIAITIMGAEPFDYGVKEVTQYLGIIQIDCVVLDGVGEIKATDIANKIVNAFPRGTVLGTTKARIDKTPYFSGGFNDGNGHYKIPVTIRYNLLN